MRHPNNQKIVNSVYLHYNNNKYPNLYQSNSNELNRTYQRIPNNNIIKNQVTEKGVIWQKINQVDNKNKMLIQISKSLSKTSILSTQYENLQNILSQTQRQLKQSFNELINNIQQFYIDIDTKLKQIVKYLVSISNGGQLHQYGQNLNTRLSSHKNNQYYQNNITNQQNNQTSKGESLQKINNKICQLQNDLQLTKINQQKLINVIQKLMDKYSLNSQTTFIKQNSFLNHNIPHYQSQVFNANLSKHNSPQKINPNLNLSYNQPNNNNPGMQNNLQFRINSNQNSQKLVNSNNILIHPVQKQQNIKTIKSLQKHNQTSSKLITNLLNVCQRPRKQSQHSIYHQLTKLQQKQQNKPTNDNKQFNKNRIEQNERRFLNFSINKKQQRIKNRPNTKPIMQNESDTNQSTTQIYNSTTLDNNPCYIKKLYSKQNHSLNKLSLKNNSNNYTLVYNNKKQQVYQKQSINNKKQLINDHSNIFHRQTYLMNNLIK